MPPHGPHKSVNMLATLPSTIHVMFLCLVLLRMVAVRALDFSWPVNTAVCQVCHMHTAGVTSKAPARSLTLCLYTTDDPIQVNNLTVTGGSGPYRAFFVYVRV